MGKKFNFNNDNDKPTGFSSDPKGDTNSINTDSFSNKAENINLLNYKKIGLEKFRKNFHKELIKKLKVLYGNGWKYSVTNNVKEHLKFPVQWGQLKIFEDGEKRTEDILHSILLDLLRNSQDGLNIKINKDGKVDIS